MDMKNKVMEMIRTREKNTKTSKNYLEKCKDRTPKIPNTRKSSFKFESELIYVN